ncbi:MAG TPA: hypothetical protein VNO17_00765 [Actinomycetota bacterium]|nr:hypothetical protein [Actinomycetota bacterium]
MRRSIPGAVLVVAVAVVAVGSTLAGAQDAEVLRFLDVRGEVHYLDEDPLSTSEFDPSPGDAFTFDNTLRNLADTRDVGRFVSRCWALFGTEFKCAGTLLLRRGTIELAASVDFAAPPFVASVVGGTGRYLGAAGQATITPTETEGTSRLVVRLVAA